MADTEEITADDYPLIETAGMKINDSDSDVDVESQKSRTYDFSDKSIRQGFIRKVYGILLVQLLITAGFIGLFLFCKPLAVWIRMNPNYINLLMLFSLIILMVLVCFDGVRRKSPANFICLFLFTVAEGAWIGVICSFYDTKSVILAAGITVFICLALTIFSFQTKWDFTGFGAYLFVALLIFLLFGIFCIFLRAYFEFVEILYSCGGALLFSFYLIYDTQLIIGGHHKNAISPEEYIYAALAIYLDIINIFLHILRLVGNRN